MLEHDVIIVGVDGCRAAVEIARTEPSLNVAVVANPSDSFPLSCCPRYCGNTENVDSSDTGKLMRLIR